MDFIDKNNRSTYGIKVMFAVLVVCTLCHYSGFSQNVEKVFFNPKDSTSGYYLAEKPVSGKIKGVVVLFRGFQGPESMLPETNLPNVASNNDLLTILASTNQKFYADSMAVDRINRILSHVIAKYAVDPDRFAIGGYDYSGMIVLRYVELAWQGGINFPVKPKAVFAIDASVDIFGFWKRNRRQIKNGFYPGSVGDAKFILDRMTSENGSIETNAARYKALTPLYINGIEPGNESVLRNVAVRVYFDMDINWHLVNRRNSFDDTNIPDGSELIKRLVTEGSTDAQFISCPPGYRSNGARNPSSLSIVDPTECVQWLKKTFGIYDANTWTPPYRLQKPEKWSTEVIAFPIDFAPSIDFKGIEDLRFAPGWGNSKTEEYWSYAYLWWVEGKPVVNENNLKANLQSYYDGLIGRNVLSRKISARKVIPTRATITKERTSEDDVKTFKGTVMMFDYMAEQPITLKCIIHQKKCWQPNRRVLLVEVSPQPFNHAVWKSLEYLNTSFRCGL